MVKSEVFKWIATNVFIKYYDNIVNQLSIKVMLVFQFTQALSSMISMGTLTKKGRLNTVDLL
jgi:hypothetical protein